MVYPRYRRVNIDGESFYKTETKLTAAALNPGIAVVIDGNGKWAAAGVSSGRLFVLGAAEHQGLGILDQIPSGDSAIGNYLEEGRTFAVRVPAGTYTEGQPVTVGAAGAIGNVPATAGTYNVIGYWAETVTTTQTADFVMMRAKTGETITKT